MISRMLLSLSLTAAVWAAGHSYTGTLVDAACKQAHAAEGCQISAQTKAFALVTADGKMAKLDEIGNAKAMAALEGRKDKNAPQNKASITGSMEGDTIKVESVTLE